MKKRSTTLKRIGLTLAGLGAIVSTGAVAAEGLHVKSEGGIMVYCPSDSAYWFSIGGRLNFDETVFSGGKYDKTDQFASGGDIRRAFLKFAGGVGDYITYNLTLDFARDHLGRRFRSSTSVDFEDAYINACSEFTGPIGVANLRFGQFTPPTSIDDWGNYGTDNDNLFLESSLATTTFAIPSKVYGVWFDATAIDMFMLSASVFQPKQNNVNLASATATTYGYPNNNYGDVGRSDRVGGALRLTFAPVHTCDTVYHLGVMGRYQSMNNIVRGTGVPIQQFNLFETTPEARARQTGSLVNTGNLRGRSYNVVNGEALAMWGPAMLEGEFYQAIVQRVPTATDPNGPTRGNPRFHGWHIEAAYVLTGEHREYDFARGTVRNPKPCSKAGAWEVAARYSFVNLVDKNVYGGSEHNATLGLNWFVNDHVKVSANYIRANIHPTGTTAGTLPVVNATNPAERDLDIFGLRFAVAF